MGTSFSFLQRGHGQAVQLLHKAGLKLCQIPQATKIMRQTVEQWLQKEIENGNAQQAVQVLKGQLQEKGPQLLMDRLQGMLLVKLMLHLGIRGALATNIVSLLLPFVLKRVYDLARQNPKMQAWWQEQDWRHQLPTAQTLGNGLKNVGRKVTSRFKKPGPASPPPLD